MPALVAVLALALLAYIPGRLLLRLLVAPGALPGGERLLLQVLLGNCALGLIGLALAESGYFSVWTAAAGMGLVAVAAALSPPAAAGGEAARPGLGAAAGLGIAAVALAWVMPPFDTTLFGHDSSVYVASGRNLAEHGSIVIADPTIDEMPLAARREFFPAYGREPGRPPFIRLAGGLLLTDLEHGRVLPAFHHLLSVFVALAYGLAGDGAVGAPAAYFAALSTLALAAFAHRLAGIGAALAVVGLLLLSVPQYWYSRFLMPEVPSQFFLWAGLVAAGASLQLPASLLGAAAGAGIGVAALMRIDGLGHLLAALALWTAIVPGRWPAGRGFLPGFALVAIYAVAHQIWFPTHYYAEAVDLVRGAGLRLWVSWGGLFAGLGLLAAAPSARRPEGRLLLRLLAAAFFAAYVVVVFFSTRPDWSTVLGWLASYVGVPAFLAAAGGTVVWLRRTPSRAETFALLLGIVVLAQIAYDPRVSPAPLWAIRRFVPVAVPLVLLAAALGLDALWRWRRLVAVVVAVAVVFGAGRTALAYRTEAFEDASAHVRAIGAALPADAVLILDPDFAIASQMHIALWTTVGLPAYLLGAQMSKPIDDLLRALPDRPVYWLGSANETALALLQESGEAIGSYRFGLTTRRLAWYEPRDDLGVRDLTVWLYRLRGGKEHSLH